MFGGRPRAASTSSRQKPLPPLPSGYTRSAPGSPENSDDEDGTQTPAAPMDQNISAERPERLSTSGPGMDTRAELDQGGRIDLWMDLKSQLKSQSLDLPEDYAAPVKEFAVDKLASVPPLNLVIFLVGSRGDIQPYIALALKLIELHSHRVRIATHGDFKSFVLNANKQLAGKVGKRGIKLEGRLLFFDVGGDPKELMTYMVKNPGLMPGWTSLTNGDVGRKKKMTGAMLRGFYSATYFADPVSGEQFAADAIISNPPTFAHVHVAEALGLPLLMSFTMPWTPTTAYGHPLVNIRASNAEPGLTNYLGYAMADQMMWRGLGGVINNFRKNILGLEKLTSSQGAGILDMLKIPWTYCWSESLLPMPKDWKEHIDISGFYFFQDALSYTPPDDLADFLKSGKPPVYIGFGSVPVENPESVTETIFEAMRATGNRAIVSAGWAGLGANGVPKDLQESVYILTKDCPHDWLFADGRLAAVCHHGGAGTTAIGLRNGLPSIIVPFFGDQKFWGDSIYRAGAGPQPVPPKTLNVETLSRAIETALDPQVKEMAEKIGQDIRNEQGELKGVASFHAHLPILNMRCDLDPTRLALWFDPDLMVKMSGAAAYHLAQAGRLDMKTLQPHRAKEYHSLQSNSDPLWGSSQAILEFATTSVVSMGQIFTKPQKGVVNTVYGIPKNFFGLLGDFYDGFENGPRMIGSEVRQMGKVDGVLSGTYQGLAGVFAGLYDGVTGLYTEPKKGHQQEGIKGAFKGTGRGLLNFAMHPTRGTAMKRAHCAIGVFVLPSRGIARSVNRWMNKDDNVLRAPRLAQSKEEAFTLSVEEQSMITRQYDDIVRLGAHARKKTIEKRMRKWFLGDDKAFAAGLDEMDDDQSDVSLSRPGSRSGSPMGELEADAKHSSSSSTKSDAPAFSSRGSYSSESRQRLAYQQRKLDRLAHRTRSSASSPLSATSGHGFGFGSGDSPPAFSSTDPHPRAPDERARTVFSEPDDTETMDSEMARDLKDMYINRYQ